MTQETEFPYVNNKSEKLKPLFNQYAFCDLAMAFFCISLKRENRSALENCLTLNQALLDNSDCAKGTQHINTYDEFELLFNQIQKLLPLTIADDYIVPDFGEVKVVFQKKAYKTFIGTGHTQVFSCLSFLEAVAKNSDRQKLFKLVLEYQDNQIEYFEKDNPIMFDDGQIRFDVPSEQLFVKTQAYFEQLDKDLITTIYKGTCNSQLIENQHFVTHKGQLYPLFNTSILVDCISQSVNDLATLHQSVLTGFYDYLNYAEQINNNNATNFLFPTIFLQDNSPLSSTKSDFAIKCDSGIIVCINYETWIREKESFEELLKNQTKSKIDIVETRTRTDENAHIAFHINNLQDVKFIIYSSSISINELSIQPCFSQSQELFMSSLDLIDLLQLSDGPNEIWDYCEYATSNNNVQLLTLCGRAGEFLSWKENGHYFEKGAVTFNFLNIDYNSEIEYVWDYFKNKLKNYPWHNVDNILFQYPTAWTINNTDQGFEEYSSKYAALGGNLLHIGNTHVFLFNNLEYYRNLSLERSNHIICDVIPVVEDMLCRMLYSLKGFIENNCLNYQIAQLQFMPIEYYYQVTHTNYTNKKIYAESDSYFLKNVLTIRYTIHEEILFDDITNTNNRSIECKFIQELFEPISKYNPILYESLCKKLNEISHETKKTDIFKVEIPYIWNPISPRYKVSDESFLWARKTIAKIFADAGIQPGEYHGKDANKTIRTAQKELINNFEKYLSNFSQYELQSKLESLYSWTIHNISIHRKRYSLMNNIDQAVAREIKDRIIKEREEYRLQKRTIEYFMESNLYCAREAKNCISQIDFEHLLAYAHWLVVLSDIADICHFTNSEAHIEISFENVVDVVKNNAHTNEESIISRMYDDYGYGPTGDDIDKANFKNVLECLKKDSGIDFSLLFDFLRFLSLEIKDYTEIEPNVFTISRTDMKRQFIELLDSPCQEITVDNIIDFLSIDANSLKTIKGKTDYYLPIGRRTDRNNRIEIKCLWESDNSLMYSPVASNLVKDTWFNGLLDFFPPYTIGLNNTVEALKQWKHHYEAQIVLDVEKLFHECGYKNVIINFKPQKLDKNDKSLASLGDYDVLVFDTKSSQIWIIECKMLSKVGSFHDMFMDQTSFFGDNGEAEHFKKRIEYMQAHHKKFLEFFNIDASNDFKIIPYMIMNKIMVSRYKPVNFEIVSISEFKKILTSTNGNEYTK